MASPGWGMAGTFVLKRPGKRVLDGFWILVARDVYPAGRLGAPSLPSRLARRPRAESLST